MKIAAQNAVDAQNMLCEQLRAAINSAFGDKIVSGVSVKVTGIGVKFEVMGGWELPRDLWFKPSSHKVKLEEKGKAHDDDDKAKEMLCDAINAGYGIDSY
jgi:RNase adaptor protein for sRNA GlmZ degradation